jgi:hypothetical protein
MSAPVSLACPLGHYWAHVPHGTCPGSAPEFPSERLLDLRRVASRLTELGHGWEAAQCWHPACGGVTGDVTGYQCADCGHYFPQPRITMGEDSEPHCRGGMGCQSGPARLARRMRGHDLNSSKTCGHPACAEAREPWDGYRHGRVVAHFPDRYVGDRALSSHLVEATSPIERTAR